ncbi:unnamed protein product [Adineta ricciae]|uniref:Ganglioside GM2 activator-like protein n=1 Tax=Adineta ricciae TaxID=249248 RepID=A0A814B0X9_ADIRI|nr:unnamed protein product [Adineta ricciae]CAF0921535.1 unnamed protein product [Adineta ricciae]
MQTIFVLFTLAVIANVQGDYNKLEYQVLSSSGAEILEADVTPMPILNPGEALLTLRANLKRPIQKIRTVLKIVRTVSGITLPVKCYKIDGVEVGSCDYADLCVVLQTMLPSFRPETCPPTAANYGVDCNCPFNIPAGSLNIIKEKMVLPDAQASIASFMASGDFSFQLDTYDSQGSYANIIIKFTVKPAKPSG